jgi:uncharacterized membrane protein (UPF0127 family)
VKRSIWRAVPVLFLLFLATLSCGQGVERGERPIGGETFRVEVARTPEQQRLGLMHRRSLGPREGMLFFYQMDQHLSFWMKDTTIPLTLAYLSKDGVILQIEQLQPLSLRPVYSERAVRYALELPRGVLEELGMGVGDRIALPAELG